MGRLLVSVRGSVEAIAAARGGAHIADVEYPATALGTPYPLNIKAVRNRLNEEGFSSIPISTNIGEEQRIRSQACQSALGVALAGAEYVKCGFAGFTLELAKYLGRNLVRTVREWFPSVKVYPALFPEKEFRTLLDPLKHGTSLVKAIDCDGLLIDTFDKTRGKSLMDYCSVEELGKFVRDLHSLKKEAWIAGSLEKNDLEELWGTNVDVICVRGAACEQRDGEGRFGEVTVEKVSELVATMSD